jgi:hypothetical protein
MKVYLAILILISISCNRTEARKHEPLSESEIYDVINQGYKDYLDSMYRQKYLLDSFFELQDSNNTIKAANYLASFNPEFRTRIIFEEEPVVYTSEKINPKLITGIHVVNQSQSDSIDRKNWRSEEELPAVNIYSISRPYRPATSEFVILQEFPVVTFMSCRTPRIKSIFLRKTNNRWKVVYAV